VNVFHQIDEKIHRLGIVDNELMKEVSDYSLDECQKLLKKCQKKLKAFGNVNKAAHKRLTFLTENLEKFVKRRNHFEVDKKLATEQLQVIKQAKREKLEWVYKETSFHKNNIN
jgi:structural maintenance of chromosome 3 (chondroitin sulfate proteoglycan 6)